jgi:outer membrane protein
MSRTLLLFFAVLLASATTGLSQKVWSLEECIEYARQNSLLAKQAQYNVRSSELQLKLDKFQRLPNLNATANIGEQFGRTIDPTSNLFVTQNVLFNGYQINASIPVFNGFRINNSVKQSKVNLQAAQLEGEATLNDLALQVAQAYLTILLSEEQVVNAQRQLELSQNQLDQALKQIAAGSLPDNDRYDFEAQLARDEQSLVVAQNNVDLNYLSLKQLMMLDPETEMEVEKPEVPRPAVDPDQFDAREVFSTAMQTQPIIRANDLRLESSRLDEKLAKSAIWPSLSVFGNLNSNYSSVARDISNRTFIEGVPIQNDVLINGEPSTITFFEDIPQIPEAYPYFDQIGDNFGQSFGAQLSVPIYNRHQNIIAVEQARVSALNREVTNQQQIQQLKTDVERAVQNAKASLESLEAAERSLEAARIAYDNAQKRFNLGAINTLQLTTARNTLDQAQASFTQARYQYIFDLKTVDFYLGKELTLE